MDGPVGALISQTSIAYFRPAHIHFIVSAPGHMPLTTHLFREGSDYIDSDVVFGARAELVVPFTVHPPGTASDGTTVPVPYCTIDYDFMLASAESR
jgi:hydroxyquinol 1,2-dioxygenase